MSDEAGQAQMSAIGRAMQVVNHCRNRINTTLVTIGFVIIAGALVAVAPSLLGPDAEELELEYLREEQATLVHEIEALGLQDGIRIASRDGEVYLYISDTYETEVETIGEGANTVALTHYNDQAISMAEYGALIATLAEHPDVPVYGNVVVEHEGVSMRVGTAPKVQDGELIVYTSGHVEDSPDADPYAPERNPFIQTGWLDAFAEEMAAQGITDFTVRHSLQMLLGAPERTEFLHATTMFVEVPIDVTAYEPGFVRYAQGPVQLLVKNGPDSLYGSDVEADFALNPEIFQWVAGPDAVFSIHDTVSHSAGGATQFAEPSVANAVGVVMVEEGEVTFFDAQDVSRADLGVLGADAINVDLVIGGPAG